jgi:ABC-2 type transport system permease protein
MGKIRLIIRREYLTRVRKKSFILLTLLGPVFWAALIILPSFLSEATDGVKRVYVVEDETGAPPYYPIFHSTQKIKYHTELHAVDVNTVKALFRDSSDVFVLYLNKDILITRKANIFSRKQPHVNLTSAISVTLSSELSRDLLRKNNIDKSLVDEYVKPVNIEAIVNNQKFSGQDKVGVLGIVMGVIIYMFVFLYSAQVMRGVIEEKSSRIVEVIISSVKPFQLMMGKILGIALVGLTQFLLWIILSMFVTTPLSRQFLEARHYQEISKTSQIQIGVPTSAGHKALSGETGASEIMDFLSQVNWPLVLGVFAFYFLIGYLMYASLFAAVGSAVDSETDTQQFMLPVSMPLILAMTMSGAIIENPNGPLAFWMSMFPLTSPITMMIRIPFHVPVWELILSMSLLVGFFVLMTWLAGRIYRTGILMYGKKTSWKEIGKWLFYKG